MSMPNVVGVLQGELEHHLFFVVVRGGWTATWTRHGVGGHSAPADLDCEWV